MRIRFEVYPEVRKPAYSAAPVYRIESYPVMLIPYFFNQDSLERPDDLSNNF